MRTTYIKINSLAFFLFGAIFLVACTKDDGPIRKDILDQIDAVPVISSTIDPTGSPSINMLDLSGFTGKFVIDMYFEDNRLPEKVDVVVRKNGGTGTSVKIFKAGVTTYPSSFTVNVSEIETLFGEPIKLGDTYDFSADIYANGKKYEAFPLGGVPNSSGPTGMPGYSYSVRYGAICKYDPAIYQGDFEVVTDEWADFVPGDIITLTKVSDNSFSFVDPFAVADTPVPIIVNVNTGNNNVSIVKTSIGTKWVWASTYTGAFVQTGGAATSSFVSPCDKTVTLNMIYSVDQGSWDPAKLVLKKI